MQDTDLVTAHLHIPRVLDLVLIWFFVRQAILLVFLARRRILIHVFAFELFVAGNRMLKFIDTLIEVGVVSFLESFRFSLVWRGLPLEQTLILDQHVEGHIGLSVEAIVDAELVMGFQLRILSDETLLLFLGQHVEHDIRDSF